MNEIIIKTYELIDELDDSNLVKEIKGCKEKLLNDTELINKIKLVKEYVDPKLKEELYMNTTYATYMEKYSELSFIIMKINQRLKDLTSRRKCNDEN